MKASVSVVIPTHNRAAMVTRAVVSGLRQSHPPAEVIVVDDASSDETVRALSRLGDPRIRIIVLESNLGGAAARNIGIEAARSDWIAFLDSDDWWLREKLELQLLRAKQSRNAAVVYSATCAAYAERAIPGSSPLYEGNVLKQLAEGWCPPTTSSFMIDHSLFDDARFDDKLPGLQDFDLWLQLATKGELFLAVRSPVTIFLQHLGDRVSRSTQSRLRALGHIREKWIGELSSIGLAETFDDSIKRLAWLTKYGEIVELPMRRRLGERFHLVRDLQDVTMDRKSRQRYAVHLLLGSKFHQARTQSFLKREGIELTQLMIDDHEERVEQLRSAREGQ